MDDRETLRERLARGEWLSPGEAAALLVLGRTKVHTMIESGAIRHRLKAGSRYRVCNPEDVARLLAESEQERGTGR